MTVIRRTPPAVDGGPKITLRELRLLVEASADAPSDTPVKARITVGGWLRSAEVAYEEPTPEAFREALGPQRPPDPQGPTSP